MILTWFNGALVLSIVIYQYESNELNKLNLVQVNTSNIVYKQLMMTKGNVLCASPLAVLDVSLLTKYRCYENIKTNLWTLGIPIIFWNDKYMENITKSINKNNPLKKFSDNSTFILPPSGIKAYRLKWRRSLNNGNDNDIYIDSSWYNAITDFVLPMWHTFIIEIKSGNDSKQKCSDIKFKLLNESLQNSELSVDFLTGEIKPLLTTDMQIKVKDLVSVKEFTESKCDGKDGKCYVSKDFAEKWSYEVSVKVMTNINGSNFNLQKLIFDGVLDFLCKEKISIDLVSVIKLKNNNENEKACIIPNNIINIKKCGQYDSYYGRYERQCRNNEEIIFTLKPDIIYEKSVKFSVPVSVM